MFDFIEENNVRYIITGKPFLVMVQYYDDNPSFEQVERIVYPLPYRDGEYEEIYIHRVVNNKMVETFQPFVSSRIPKMLQIFSAYRHDEFQLWSSEVMMRYLDISEHEFNKIYFGEVTCFHERPARGDIVACEHYDKVK